jgi:hypothetical protein
MSQPAGTYQDGNLAFGSQQISLTNPGGGSAITFLADNIDFTGGTKVLTRPNTSGVASAEVMIDEPITGSMTLQVPAAGYIPTSGALIRRGATGTMLNSDGVETIAIKISEVGAKFSVDGEVKIPVSFRQKLN